MKGLLTDVNIQGELRILRVALVANGLAAILDDLGIEFLTFRDLGLQSDMEDRPLWNLCQRERLVLLTDNRNQEDPNSLQATLNDSLQADSLPVLTPGDKRRFRSSPEYQLMVAESVGEVLLASRKRTFIWEPGDFFFHSHHARENDPPHL